MTYNANIICTSTYANITHAYNLHKIINAYIHRLKNISRIGFGMWKMSTIFAAMAKAKLLTN